MTVHDSSDHRLSGASPRAADHFRVALGQLQCFVGDPVASVQLALDDSPDFVMAHALHGWLHLIGTEAAAVPVARAAIAAAGSLPATDRERGHLQAMSYWADGQWAAAARTLEDLTIAYPRDALALQAGHALDFFRGDARMLRDRIARALPHWSPDLPDYHAVLGMHAFGLEENGQYAEAEAAGRHALSLQRRDGWAWHAVTHVMEMQDRISDGVAWLTRDTEAWSHESFFAVHNWWHLALFRIEQGDFDAVLALYDGPIRGQPSPLAMDLIDASALLWRLRLLGVDVGDRWQSVAEGWAPQAGSGYYAFNDAHAAMSFLAAGRRDLLDQLKQAQARAVQGNGDNARFTQEVGMPLVSALASFEAGDYGRASSRLREVRAVAQRFGGSHAQRDLIDLTLMEAALRGGDATLSRALAIERQALKPGRDSAAALMRRAMAMPTGMAARAA